MNGVLTIIDNTIGKEGGYSNHPSDRGGPTRWGITQDVARANGYAGDMRQLPRELAVSIYLKRYWTQPRFSTIEPISVVIAEKMFDIGVNMGVSWPTIFLQQALNVLNRQGKDYSDINEDGDLGPATRSALAAYLKKRGKEGEAVLLTAIKVLQGSRYIAIAKARPKNEDFVYGWLRTRIDL